MTRLLLSVHELELDCESCETALGLGSPGNCSLQTETCVCPPGFSGIDEFIVFDTCHVNEELATRLNLVSAILASCPWFSQN